MNVKSCTHLAIFLVTVGVAVGLAAQQPPTGREDAVQVVTAVPPVSKAVVPQIVRLSYVQGDVRVSRGRLGKREDGAVWEQAAVNLPLATGFSLVTGKGRAEIEFEDASTMYLGEDSVLTFDNLTTKQNVPHTEMALLTGVATLHLKPEMPGEAYFLKTPTDTLHVPFGIAVDMRVNSYLDAVTLTPVWFASSHPARVQTVSVPVESSVTYSNGVRELTTTHTTADHVSEWDSWVAQRVATREAAMSEVMGEAGLEKPLPGLADMKAEGKFFRCDPYGMCWEPNKGWGTKRSGGQQANGQAVSGQGNAAASGGEQQGATQQEATQRETTQQETTQQQAAGSAQPYQSPGGGYGVVPIDSMYQDGFGFPCSPYGGLGSMGGYMGQDLSMGEDDLFYDSDLADNYGFDWAVCHSGSWIQQGGRYAWVVQGGLHHQAPVRWVTVKGKLGYVPIHPGDVAGKAPMNVKHGLYVAEGPKGGSFARQGYNSGESMKMLKSPPKGFREPGMPALAGAKESVTELSFR